MLLNNIKLAATTQENLNLTQTEQIVQIETTGEVENMETVSPIHVPDLEASAISDRDHTVKDVLSRNFKLAEVSWDSTAKTGDTLYTADFPSALLTQKTTIDKLNNFYGFMSQVRIIIILNAQVFQQGALLVGLFPNTTNLPGKFLNYKKSMRMIHGGMSKVFSVGQERLEMVLPYTLPQPYVKVGPQTQSFGTLVIKCLSPLGGVGSTTCSFTVMANFENPKPVFPGTNTIKSSRDELKAILKNMSWNEIKQLASGAHVPQINTDVNNDATKLVTAPNMALIDERGTSHVINPTNEKLSKINMPSLTSDDMMLSNLFSIPILFSMFNVSANAKTPLLWASNVGPTQIANFTPNLPSNVIETDFIQYISTLFKYWNGTFKFHFQAFKTVYSVVKLRVFFAPGVDAKDASTVDPSQVYSKVIDLNAATTEFDFDCEFVSTTPVLSTSSSIGCIGVMLETKLNYASVSVPDNFDIVVSRSAPDLELGGLIGISYRPYKSDTTREAQIKMENTMASSKNLSVKDLLKISTFNFSGPPTSTVTANPEYTTLRVNFPGAGADFQWVGFAQNTDPAIPISNGSQNLDGSTELVLMMPLTDKVTVFDSAGTAVNLIQGDIINMNVKVPDPTSGTYSVLGFFANSSSTKLVVCDKDHNALTYPALIPKNDIGYYFKFPSSGSGPDPPDPPVTSEQWFKIYPSTFSVGTNNLVDYLDYLSLIYAYYRGGIKLRINSESSLNVTAMMDIGERVLSTKNLVWAQPTETDVLATSGLPSQLMSLPLEGFVDIEIPYYSRYPYHSARLDNTQGSAPLVLAPNSLPKKWDVYRSSDEDFEFSCLIGPPMVLPLS